ncbi:hypothetical protein SAMN05660337_1239 [Maridesulfovibrio ferrireducens]|uniref:Uncharacterized protein n=1 Tax=Maridesulfovibrio ferrireducens TaxID=246191 RepID=A0A1G9ERV2_9BACT|nr:hypothetical protein [Maridesulfovibrio ferrireducens]SDK78814.1 hypothetical protein SAMN05660337_1239 [Maridesulfovibrio ferrireducens]
MAVEKYNIKLATLKIAAVEKAFNVNRVILNGLKVWPLVRLHLYRILFWNKNDFIPQEIVCFNIPNYSKDFPELARNVSRTELLWFSDPEYHSDMVGGKYYSRFEDPFIEMFGKYDIRKVEFQSAQSQQKRPRLHEPYYLCPVIESAAVAAQNIPEIENFEELAIIIESICGVKLDTQQIFRSSAIVFFYTDYFLDLLKKVSPKAVFLACYYSEVKMALIRACNMLGIPTVEYQHGKQGKYHCMYTHWTTIPQGGYELLPRFFWNWGKESADNISIWLDDDEVNHTTLVGGNPWLGLWVNKMWPEDLEIVSSIEQVIQGKKAILVTLQPLAEILPDILITAMRKSPEDWVWFLRVPPARKSRMDEVLAVLKANGIENYEIEISNKASLYSLLKRVDQHVTCYSSVCYEALSFGINSVLIHPVAKDLYPEYIEQKIFIYESDGEALVRTLEGKINSKFIPEMNPYIVTELKAAQKSVGVILAQDRLNKINISE